MKTSLAKKLMMVGAAFFLSFTMTAQSVNDEILAGVPNPGDYETIELAQMDPNLSTFMNLVALSNFGTSWKLTDNEHTVMIPTNQAFNEMSIERYLHLTNPKNSADLVRFVKYHFLPNRVNKNEFNDSQVITTQGQDEISVSSDSNFDAVYIGGAKVIKSLEASDGNVHILNGVINPKEDFLSVD